MVRVENLTRGTTLAGQGRLANNAWTRLKGLIGVKHLPEGDGMVITPCSSVHCMFMSIPIDVLYVNRDHQVVGIDPHLKPWAIGHIYRGVRYVVELPAGVAARTATQVGDQLRLT